MSIFNTMPDKLDGMAGFVGKDFSSLGTILDIKSVPKNIQSLVLDIILYLNNKALMDYQTKQKSSRKRAK